MPELEIRDWENQDETEKWITWQRVWAAMLFPNKVKPTNPSFRKDFLVASVATLMHNLKDEGKLTSENIYNWTKKYFDPVGGIYGLLCARSIDDMEKKIQQASKEGYFAGYQLFEVAGLSKTLPGQTKKKKNIKMSIGIAAFLVDERFEDITRTSAEKYWEDKRPVIHLWAARNFHSRFLPESESDSNLHDFQPFGLQGLPLFLAVAEKFKQFGLGYCPRDKKKPLLDEKILYSIPKDFPLPELKFELNAEKMEGVIEMIDNDYKATVVSKFNQKNK